MCGSPDGKASEADFLNYVKNRVANRQLRHGDILKGRERPEKPDFEYEPRADICYAYSKRDDYFYVGFSGSAGGMSKQGRITNTRQARDRLDRLDTTLQSPHLGRALPRPVCNCAEACALSIAISYQQSLSDLFFITFYPRVGPDSRLDRKGLPQTKQPCPNCASWVKWAAGYCQEDGRFVCNKKRDRDDDEDNNREHKRPRLATRV